MSDETPTEPSTSAPEAPEPELPERAEAPDNGENEPARAQPSALDAQRARFERALAAGAQPRARRALEEVQPDTSEAEEEEEPPRPRGAPQRARTRSRAATRDRSPRTALEKLGRAETLEDFAALLEFGAERGMVSPRLARTAGAVLRKAGSVPSTGRVVAREDAQPERPPPPEGAQPAPAEGAPEATTVAASTEPAAPEMVMGQPASVVDVFGEPARAMAELILRFAARHGMDLTKGQPRTLHKGTSIEREVSPDLTVPLTEALSAAMAKRAPKGLAGAADPDKIVLALLSPVALPLAKAVLTSTTGPLLAGVRAVGVRARGLFGRRS